MASSPFRTIITGSTLISKEFDHVYICFGQSNVGHPEGAAGLSVLVKSTLALNKSMIPPNVNFNRPIIVAYLRGLAFAKQAIRPSCMAAIGLNREAVTPYLRGDPVIACENSPQSVSLVGDVEDINNVMARINGDSPDVFARRLKVEMAFHSRKFSPRRTRK